LTGEQIVPAPKVSVTNFGGATIQKEVADKNFRAFLVVIVGSRHILVREMDRYGNWISNFQLGEREGMEEGHVVDLFRRRSVIDGLLVISICGTACMIR